MERKQMQEFVKVCLSIFSCLESAVVKTQDLLAFDAMDVELD